MDKFFSLKKLPFRTRSQILIPTNEHNCQGVEPKGKPYPHEQTIQGVEAKIRPTHLSRLLKGWSQRLDPPT